MQNSKRESTGNGTAALAGGVSSPIFVDTAEVAGAEGYLTGSGRASPFSDPRPQRTQPIRKPGP